MRSFIASAVVALSSVAIVNCIPIAQQQVLAEIQRTEQLVTQLEADVIQSNAMAAQTDYRNIQHELDAFGMYLGQITDSTCVADGPGSSTVSVTKYYDVLTALQLLQADMINISAGVLNRQTSTSVAAYQTAQQKLESTYEYVFGSAISYGILQGLQN
ncbi:hypothetical protein LTR78_010433 [Recurvomyces mirabilis]|uniref:Uncharacterized protein n=1 Tax=Recurvomyces mirabilis TaxID=574656 RepID=A0AAE0WF26_9PEZI|nr:hypothetical protein LTR78_010433 [Recurvomyces mirabilis]KAK4552459.1 hypothetical protein LTR86_010302 [Recurvomyces mirabilis]KAK5150511.1 hypothetical protein LTS14_010004 [Recurvomyces mirabilis]